MTLKDKVSIKRSSTFGLKSGNICHKLMKITLGEALPAIIYHCFLLFCAINGMKKCLYVTPNTSWKAQNQSSGNRKLASVVLKNQ